MLGESPWNKRGTTLHQALQAVDESLRELRATFENKLRKRRDALSSALGLVALVGDQDRDGGRSHRRRRDGLTDEDFTDVEPVSAHEASERRAELAKAASSSQRVWLRTTPTLRSSKMPSVTRRKRVVERTATPSSA